MSIELLGLTKSNKTDAESGEQPGSDSIWSSEENNPISAVIPALIPVQQLNQNTRLKERCFALMRVTTWKMPNCFHSSPASKKRSELVFQSRVQRIHVKPEGRRINRNKVNFLNQWVCCCLTYLQPCMCKARETSAHFLFPSVICLCVKKIK